MSPYGKHDSYAIALKRMRKLSSSKPSRLPKNTILQARQMVEAGFAVARDQVWECGGDPGAELADEELQVIRAFLLRALNRGVR